MTAGPDESDFGEVWLVVRGDKEERIRLGDSMGGFRETQADFQSSAPAGTVLTCLAYWAGAGDAWYVAVTDKALVIYHQSLEEMNNGTAEEMRRIALSTGSKVTAGSAVDVPVPDRARTLSVQTPLLSGDDVDYVQLLLRALGFTEVGAVDGVFGQKTRAAVMRFQKANGLSADGVVGRLTWEKLTDTDVTRGD